MSFILRSLFQSRGAQGFLQPPHPRLLGLSSVRGCETLFFLQALADLLCRALAAPSALRSALDGPTSLTLAR